MIKAARYAGDNFLLVQGGGGNVSVKSANGKRMLLKASGFRLSELGPEQGYLEMDLQALVSAVRQVAMGEGERPQVQAEFTLRLQSAVKGGTSLKPSIEAGLHSLLGRVVLHTHPVYFNAFACMEGGHEALAEATGNEAAWVGYCSPGYELAAAVDRESRRYKGERGRLPSMIALQNHGLIASGRDGGEVIAVTEKAIKAGLDYFGPIPPSFLEESSPSPSLVNWADGLREFLEKTFPLGEVPVVRVAARQALIEAAREPDRLLLGGPVVPDDVVYTDGILESVDVMGKYSPNVELVNVESYRRLKRIFVLPGLGVVFIGPSEKSLQIAEDTLTAHALVCYLAGRRGRVMPLPRGEVAYIRSMDSEKYRQAVADETAGGESVEG